MNRFDDGEGRVWFITGCSTGFGQALARAVLARGERAVVTARRPEALAELAATHGDRVLPLSLDVLDANAVRTAVDAALGWCGRIDVLVNNAGYGLVGAVEEVEEAEVGELFETNVSGVLRMIQAVLPSMRAHGAGHIVNISSMGGLVAFAGLGLYSASKFAIEGLSEALALELAPFGIGVTIVEPGPFRTGFRGGLRHSRRRLAAYDDTVGKIRATMADPAVKPPGDPERAVQVILAALDSPSPPLRLPLGQACYDGVAGKMQKMSEEMDKWRELALNTAFAVQAD